MTEQSSHNLASSHELAELNIHELWGIALTKKYAILAIASGIALIMFFISLLIEDEFRAEALLTPPTESSERLNSQLGLAASIAGLNVNSSPERSLVTNSLAVMQSREFLSEFLRNRGILPWLFASEYDPSSGESIIDPQIFDSIANTWVDAGGLGEPSQWEAYEKFSEMLQVVENEETGLIRVSMDWNNPVLAATWINWLVEDINNHMKQKDIVEAERAIQYLQSQLQSTQLVEMQRIFYQLIESQTRILMLADVRAGYVFDLIDRAVAPEEKIAPNRPLLVFFGFLAGLVCSICWFILARSLELSRKPS